MRPQAHLHVKDVPKVYFCPECVEQFETPQELGPHLERHYDPVPVGQPRKTRGVSRRSPRYCPQGCGRLFSKNVDQYDFKSHVTMCDGQAPIAGTPQFTLIPRKEMA
jgi:hypothetical protein